MQHRGTRFQWNSCCAYAKLPYIFNTFRLNHKINCMTFSSEKRLHDDSGKLESKLTQITKFVHGPIKWMTWLLQFSHHSFKLKVAWSVNVVQMASDTWPVTSIRRDSYLHSSWVTVVVFVASHVGARVQVILSNHRSDISDSTKDAGMIWVSIHRGLK